MTRVISLTDNNGSALLRGMASALYARDSRKRYFYANFGGSEIGVFDSTGRFLRSIGRRGGGPEEFRGIVRILVAPGDTLRVYDAPNARETVFSPDLRIVRRKSLPGRWSSMVLLPADRLVVNMVSGLASLAGWPLHVLDADRRIVRSFGVDEPFYRQGFESVLQRALALAENGDVYALRAREYVIEQWDTLGMKRRELVRDVPWFRLDLTPWRPGQPPQPISRNGLTVDRNGLLWILVNVADRHWKSARVHSGPHGTTIRDYNKYVDTMIEVIDPRRGVLIASKRVDQQLLMFFGELLTASWREADDGTPHLDIWQFTLSIPQ